MSTCNNRSKSLKILLATNCVLFFCTLTIASVVTIIAFSQSSLARQIDTEMNAQQALEAKYAQLLLEAKTAIQEKDDNLEEIRRELVSGYVISKDVDVYDSRRAHWLSEPKLMLGVNRLSGGSLQINFANRREMISVGERIDFRADDCDCYLLLKSSTFGHASFRFACNPTRDRGTLASSRTIIDARVN